MAPRRLPFTKKSTRKSWLEEETDKLFNKEDSDCSDPRSRLMYDLNDAEAAMGGGESPTGESTQAGTPSTTGDVSHQLLYNGGGEITPSSGEGDNYWKKMYMEMANRCNRIAEERECDFGRGRNSVREGGVKPSDGGTDATNYDHVANVATLLFRNVKVLPQDWSVWSTDPRSIAQRIMNCGVTVPQALNSKFYFLSQLRKNFHTKYRILRTNYQSVMREAYQGENTLG